MAKKKGGGDPYVRQAKRAVRTARQQMVDQIANATNEYNRGLGDSDYVAGEVGDFLGANRAKIGQGYADTASKQAAGAAALQAQLAANNRNSQADAGGALSRLGIGGNLGQMQSDGAFAAGQAGQQAANDQSNTAAAGTNADAVSALLGGMNQGQRQFNAGQLATQRIDADNEVRNTFRQFRQEQIGRIQDYKAQKAAQAAAAAAYRSHYHSYGSGGGGHYSSYGHSSGGSDSGSSATANAQLALLNPKKPHSNPKTGTLWQGLINMAQNFNSKK